MAVISGQLLTSFNKADPSAPLKYSLSPAEFHFMLETTYDAVDFSWSPGYLNRDGEASS